MEEEKISIGGKLLLDGMAESRWIPGADFHMQAQVFTEKVSCQGLFWKEK